MLVSFVTVDDVFRCGGRFLSLVINLFGYVTVQIYIPVCVQSCDILKMFLINKSWLHKYFENT